MQNPQQKSGNGHPPHKNILNNKTEASGASPLQPPRLHTRPHHWTSAPGLGLGAGGHCLPAWGPQATVSEPQTFGLRG